MYRWSARFHIEKILIRIVWPKHEVDPILQETEDIFVEHQLWLSKKLQNIWFHNNWKMKTSIVYVAIGAVKINVDESVTVINLIKL